MRNIETINPLPRFERSSQALSPGRADLVDLLAIVRTSAKFPRREGAEAVCNLSSTVVSAFAAAG
jgi:hypothetical protein